MKLKIIDLLTKIATQEAPPKKIKWNYHVYIYDEQYDDYYEETTALFENEMGNGMLFKSLNDYVEIIEEKQQESIQPLAPISFEEFKRMNPVERYHATIVEYDKIEELRVAVNYLLKKEDE